MNNLLHLPLRSITPNRVLLQPQLSDLPRMDVLTYLAPRPESVFLCYVGSEGLKSAGLYPGDLLVCDYEQPARDGSVVLTNGDDKLVIGRLRIRDNKVMFTSGNGRPREIDAGCVVGIVTHSVHHLLEKGGARR